MEAGVGTLLRLQPGQADILLLIAEPTAKSIEVARRAAEISEGRARVIVVANKVRDNADIQRIRQVLSGHELVVVPEDEAIARADRDGLAPIDVDPQAAGVQAVVALAERLRASA